MKHGFYYRQFSTNAETIRKISMHVSDHLTIRLDGTIPSLYSTYNSYKYYMAKSANFYGLNVTLMEKRRKSSPSK